MFRSRLNTLRNIWNGQSLNFAANWRLPLRLLLRNVPMPQADDHGVLLCALVLPSCALCPGIYLSVRVDGNFSQRRFSTCQTELYKK